MGYSQRALKNKNISGGNNVYIHAWRLERRMEGGTVTRQEEEKRLQNVKEIKTARIVVLPLASRPRTK